MFYYFLLLLLLSLFISLSLCTDGGDDPKLFDATDVYVRQQQNVRFEDVSIDAVRRFWNERPCNLYHSRAERGTRRYYDEVEARKYHVEPHIAPFAEFSKWQGKQVLEIGCGLGTEAINFVRAGANLTAIDVSNASLALARARLAAYDFASTAATFLLGNAETLADDYEHRLPKFDLIWSFGVLHHTPQPWRAVAQMHRLLSDNGEARVMVYAKCSYKLFYLMKETGIWDMSIANSLIAQYSEAQSGCPITYAYLRDEIASSLFMPPDQWEIIDIQKRHIFTWNITEYREHRWVKDRAWRDVDEEQLAALERELGWHMLIRARKKKQPSGDKKIEGNILNDEL